MLKRAAPKDWIIQHEACIDRRNQYYKASTPIRKQCIPDTIAAFPPIQPDEFKPQNWNKANPKPTEINVIVARYSSKHHGNDCPVSQL